MPKLPERIYRRGGVLWGRYKDEHGLWRRRSTGCVDPEAAAAELAEWEREAKDPLRHAANQTTLEHVLDGLIDYLEGEERAGRKSEATVEYYRLKAGHWLTALGRDFKAARLSATTVDDFIATRRGHGVTESTIGKELVTLHYALRVAKRRGRWQGDSEAIFPVRFSPQYKPKERFLTPAELRLLLPRLWRDHAAQVAFALATSAELGAIRRAERADVAGDLSTALVRGTKRPTRWRTVPLVTDWQRDLLGYALRHAQGEGGMLFGSPKLADALKFACRTDPSLAHCSPNDLRRTCATWLRAEGVSPHLLAPVLGHTTSYMAERVYARLKPADLAARLRAELGLPGACTTGVPNSGGQDGLGGRIGRLDDLPEPRATHKTSWRNQHDSSAGKAERKARVA